MPRVQVRAELDRQRLALKAEGLKLAPLRAEAEERRRANNPNPNPNALTLMP